VSIRKTCLGTFRPGESEERGGGGGWQREGAAKGLAKLTAPPAEEGAIGKGKNQGGKGRAQPQQQRGEKRYCGPQKLEGGKDQEERKAEKSNPWRRQLHKEKGPQPKRTKKGQFPDEKCNVQHLSRVTKNKAVEFTKVVFLACES